VSEAEEELGDPGPCLLCITVDGRTYCGGDAEGCPTSPGTAGHSWSATSELACVTCGEPGDVTVWGPIGIGGVCRDPFDPTDYDQGQHEMPTPARWVTLPGDQQHTTGPDCPCRPVVWPSGAVDHR
jgi:hypothetical protein